MASCDVSVVVRSCGRATLLRRAFACLEAQTLPPKEVILVAIGTDGIEAAATAPAPLCMQSIPVPDGRIRGGALNDGVRASQAPWVAFLDDDDTWSPTFLEEMTNVAVAQKAKHNFGGVVCRTEAVYERVECEVVTQCGREAFNPQLERVSAEGLFQQNCFTINAALWRRTVFEAVGGFSEVLPVLEDWDFNFRAAVRFQIAVLPRMLACYHMRPRTDPLPNTRMRDHGRVAARLQREWFKADLLGSCSSVGRWRQRIWMAGASLSRGRARFGNWRRWKSL